MSDAIKHECGLAFIRLRKPLHHYQRKYGTALLGEDGRRVVGFPGGAGGGSIGLWSDRYYIGIGAGVVRKYYNGATDWSYNSESIFISSIHGGQFHTYPDGKVLMTGGHDLWSLDDTTFLGPNHCLVRLDTTGALDPTFQHRRCQDGVTQKILRLPDGKFLLAGQQDIYDDQPVGHVLRVHEDGSIDTTFNTTIDFGYATDYYFYPDGRILCTGLFHTPELPGDTVQLLRLMPDGSVDQSFNYDLEFQLFPEVQYPPAVAQGLYELDPATLLIGGSFTTLNDEWVGGIFVMDTAGNILQDQFTGMGCDSLTFTFGGSWLYLHVRDLELAPDGSLYVYGAFHGFDDGYINDPEQRMIVKLKLVDVGIENAPAGSEPIRAWPNPGEEELFIALEDGTPMVSIRALDTQGRTVYAYSALSNPMHINASGWSAGLYLIEVRRLGGSVQRTQWIKQ